MWGSSTTGSSFRADLGPLFQILGDIPLIRGVKNYYKTGVLDEETERRLQVRNPTALAAIKAGNAPPLEEVIRPFFGQMKETPPLATPEQVIQALQPPQTEPARLLAPPVAQQPTLAPEFKIPLYAPKTISPGWEEDYTNKMVDILTTPKQTLETPSVQQQVDILGKLLQRGENKLAGILGGLLPSTSTYQGGITEWNPLTRTATPLYTPPEEFTPVMTEEQALAAGKVKKGTEIIKPERGTTTKTIYGVDKQGNMKVLGDVPGNADIRTIEGAPGDETEDVVIVDPETGNIKKAGSVPKGTRIITRPRAEAPQRLPIRPNFYKQNIANGLAAIKSGRPPEEIYGMLAQQYPEYQSELKGIIWPQSEADMALAEIYRKVYK